MSTMPVSIHVCTPLADALPLTQREAHHQSPFVYNWAHTLLKMKTQVFSSLSGHTSNPLWPGEGYTLIT